MYPLRGNNPYVHQQQPPQPYSDQPAYGQNLGPNVGASQMAMYLPSRYAAMLSAHPSSVAHHGSMAPTTALQPRLDVASGLGKELPQALTHQSASVEGTSRMYPSRGNIVYGQQLQQPYSGQYAYDQNLRPVEETVPSRHAAILSGHPSSAARYSSLQVPDASGKVSGPFGLEGQIGYGSTIEKSPKYASGSYFTEQPTVYTIQDSQNQPTARFTDSVAYGHHQHQMENNTNTSSLSLRSILEKDKLNRTNFLDWYRNLRIVLKHERKLYVLDARVPPRPEENATRAIKTAYEKHVNDSIDVGCLMLNTMIPDLQKDLERLQPYEMIVTLRKMFQHQTRQERFETIKAMHSCKMSVGGSVSSHFMKMNGYFDRLDRLGFPIPQDLAIDFVLCSLPKSYDEFVTNYTMNSNMDESFSELHSMLKTVEKSIDSRPNHFLMVRKEKPIKMHGKPNNHALMVKKGKVVKIQGKGKTIVGKPKPEPKPKHEPKPKVDDKVKNSKEEATCFHCNEVGHWKRNCKLYLEELKKEKANKTDT